jgi:hypothetical protein
MRSRWLLVPALVFGVAAPSPALAGETVLSADPLTQLERIETEVKAVRQAGDTGRLAKLREELRQLPVPASAVVRASRIWAMTRGGGDAGAAGSRARLQAGDDPPDDGSVGPGGKTAASAWTVELSLDDPPDDPTGSGGGKTAGTAWDVEVALDQVSEPARP